MLNMSIYNLIILFIISKDKRMNKEGRKLLKLLEETGLVIWNGNVEGD